MLVGFRATLNSHWLIFIVNMERDAWIWNSCDAPSSESGQLDNLLIRKNQIECQFVMPLSCCWQPNHNIVKIVCGSTWLSPRGSTATLTMLWRNSWSITGQTHKKTDVNLLNTRPVASVIALKNFWNLEKVYDPTGEWAKLAKLNKMAEGKEHKC